ncbi:hypothetical protein [uncultured Mediterranean phage uvMED]|nr:hypothetical protein [uncultured Mediterranean phage uvMED]BAQ88938.1 hypothetical protein [uncultured Mediterranean phage uvMED]BAQ88943.1 hypothetical protein [uncultured Mediterranean phage uvMED]BAQ88999.1 hypothetical protein [uncultured Mediterranean phage uvMED]BAQ89075.1 hypothetical protein [uncultured Mediterranean phage uvMED]
MPGKRTTPSQTRANELLDQRIQTQLRKMLGSTYTAKEGKMLRDNIKKSMRKPKKAVKTPRRGTKR